MKRIPLTSSLIVGIAGALILGIVAVAVLPVKDPLEIGLILALVALAVVGAFFQQRSFTQTESTELIEHNHEKPISTESLEQQGSSIDVLADGLDIEVFICDEAGGVVYANSKAKRMFDFSTAEDATILSVTLSYDLQTFVADTFKTREKQITELTFGYPEERIGLCESWPDLTGERVFLAIQDVTQLRRLERVRRDFVANVSHELRTPLAAIRAMTETMVDERDDLVMYADRYLLKIIAEVDRLSLISADLLSLTSAESNPVRKHACDIAEIYINTVNQLQHKALAKGLSLTYQGPTVLDVEANSAQMTQVAINLIDNAINYTNFGAVAINIELSWPNVIIKVQDTGIGIPVDQISRIFERFYRADKARSRATGGTGLGLSIVRHIVEVHGGTVKVESQPNEGSTFTVVLPIGDITNDEKSSPE
ncbi:MAG TPA: ATP-binding protein [Fimbriimonadaceae bacterium]|jgi:two-component system phosphate regulon sensor histidine kinase PhoR